jgi:4,4'-diaponeurosporenoate glycosyltransferase
MADVDPVWFAVLGWLVGLLLWGRPNRLGEDLDAHDLEVAAGGRTTVVIPARNEAEVLPLLLADLEADPDPNRRVVVVDDHSEDDTGVIARRFAGVDVIDAPPLPTGWTGKSWACHVGVHHLDHRDDDVVVFLDADVRVRPGAVAEVVAQVRRDGGVVSVQPFHATERPYEQLSLFPGIISLLGTGAGWTARPPSGVFGPVLATTVADYRAVGGHAAVQDAIAEDVALGLRYRKADLPVAIRLGGDRVRFRMYPEGLRQLAEGWTKNMATGAGAVPLYRSLGAFWWIAAAGSAAMSLPWIPGNSMVTATTGVVLYGLFVAQVWGLGRVTGRFGLLTALAYPLLLMVFVTLFVWSTWRLRVRRSVRWRGRTVPLGGTPPAG